MKTKLLLSAMLLITVLISYGQWTYTNLSEPKDRMGAVVLGSIAYFGGGEDDNGNPVSTVEIYNVETEVWEPMIGFQVPRMHPAGVSCGTKIIFAGGADFRTMPPTPYDNVDIWDTVTQQWTYKHLMEPRAFLSAVSKENIVLFAGGTDFPNATDIVDIYDVSTGTWTYATLSVARSCMGAAVIGNLALFAGGYLDAQQTVTDIVDIYNFTTKTWTTDTLSQARAFLTAVAIGDVILFAGGTDANNESSNRVDIYHASDGTWTIDSLSVPRALYPEPVSAAVCGKAYFVGGAHQDLYTHWLSSDIKIIDIYDANTGAWSADSLTEVKILYAVAGVDDHLLVAGGYNGDELRDVEIYIDADCVNPGINDNKDYNTSFIVFPNPSSGIIDVEISEDHHKSLQANIYNMQGQLVLSQTLVNNDRELNLQLPEGLYVLRVIAEEKVYSELITIQN
jgi:hypothetical protein